MQEKWFRNYLKINSVKQGKLENFSSTTKRIVKNTIKTQNEFNPLFKFSESNNSYIFEMDHFEILDEEETRQKWVKELKRAIKFLEAE